MEKVTKRLANRISQSLGYDAQQEAVVAYGLFAVTQIAVTISLTLLFGWLAGAPLEALIVCLSVSLYRKYSGGAHAQSATSCLVVTIVYCTLAALAVRWLSPNVEPPWLLGIASGFVYGFAYWATHRYAPVDSPHKPIKSEQKIKRMRKGSFLILTAYLALQLFFCLIGYGNTKVTGYGLSLLFGVFWQAFTLTPLGIILLSRQNVLPKSSGKEVS